MKYICVFCSANDLEEKYVKPAREFARLMTEHEYNLVWGGSETGLMKIIADDIKMGGGKLIGVSMKILEHVAYKNADELIIEKDLSTRKATLLARSDAIVVLVGGIGTLDEVTEILELKKHGVHNKPIVILNTENFYEGFKVQLKKMKDDGFIKKPLEDLLYFADSPTDALQYIEKRM